MSKSDDQTLVFNRIFVVYPREADLTEDDFRENFERFGDIKQVHIAKKNDEPKGVTYIRFEKTSQACRAAEEMHLETLPGLDKKIKVHLATDKKPEIELDVEKDKMLLRLFIHYPKQMTQDELKEYFEQFGEVTWIYQLKEKSKSSVKAAAFVKFATQSQSALALEHCVDNPEGDFRARWADVRQADPNAPHKHGLSKEMIEKGGGKFMQGGGAGRYGGDGMRGGGGMMMDGWGANSDGGMDPMSLVNSRGSMDHTKTVIEALVPSSMTEQQARRLFNIPPGLVDFGVDYSSGIVKCQYQSPACAAYAKEAIDGMELLGHTIAVRYQRSQGGSNPAGQLQQTMRQLQSGNLGNVNNLVEQLQQVTQAISQGAMQGGGGGMSCMDIEPVSSVRLPPIKPLMDIEARVAQKLFINSSNKRSHLFSNDVLVNIMCRFGNLISAAWIPGKRFGFASFGKKSSAEAARRALNDSTIEDNLLVVELSNQDDAPRGGKRSRMD